MPTPQLPRSTPSEQSLSSAGVLDFLDVIEGAPDLELHSLMILRHGQVVVEGWWAPYTAEDVHLLYSLSKSFTSTALGFAVAEGLVGLDDPVVSFFPQWVDETTHPWTRAMRVRHLAAMATGHRLDTLERAHALDHADPVHGFLQIPPDQEPGSVFCYNNTATYTLATILQQVTGQSLSAYLRPRLFDPLGITRSPWDSWPPGRELGFTGLHLTTESIARFGQVLLEDGRWAGEQLLPEGWVAEATRQHIPNPGEPNPDWQQGYGFQFWRARHGYRGDGAFGQFCLVLPEQDAVVVTTAATENMQGVLDAAWAYLLPAFDQPGSPTLDRQLASRTGALSLAVPSHGAVSSDSWLTVRSMEPMAGGWRVTAEAGGTEMAFDCGDGDWVRTTVPTPRGLLPIEARGSRETADCLTAEVVFVETPHHLRVRFWPEGARSEGHWHTAPLGFSPVLDLANPR